MSYTYQVADWARRLGYRDADAQAIGEHIEQHFGTVDAIDTLSEVELLDSARPVDSAIHGYYEWDDSVAGELFRTNEARQHLYMLRVIRIDEETQEEINTRMFHLAKTRIVSDAVGREVAATGPSTFVGNDFMFSLPELREARLIQAEKAIEKAVRVANELLDYAVERDEKGRMTRAVISVRQEKAAA